MSKRNSHMYPGPGSYEHGEKPIGPHIGFTQEKKKTSIKKTDDPGPNSYYIHPTVGVIPEWSDYEANPRPIVESPTKRDRGE